MDAYIFQADIICADCAPKVETAILMRGLDTPGGWAKFVRDWEREDSDHFPQGPYADGGGEADVPQHCGTCGVFMKNPLTTDGEDYLKDQILGCQLAGEPSDSVVLEWIDNYL